MEDADVAARYDRLLAAIGERAGEIGTRPVLAHWPHVGSAYRGLVIVGQAVYGWDDRCQAAELRSPQFRARFLAQVRSRPDRPEPLDWIAGHRVRTSPWWRAVRQFAEALEPELDAPWFARFAWVNLYPAAPDDPPGNPVGPLQEAQDPHVGGLLRAITDSLDATRVILPVGNYWWPAAGPAGLVDLPEVTRPLLRAGRSGGRTWVIGWHPTGASHRRFGPGAYARVVTDAVTMIEASS